VRVEPPARRRLMPRGDYSESLARPPSPPRVRAASTRVCPGDLV